MFIITISIFLAKSEFLKAVPNANILWEAFGNQFNYMLGQCGYSYDSKKGSSSGSGGSTATEQHYNKDKDIITTAIKRKLREEQINTLIGNMLVDAGLWDGNDKKPFLFKINDHFLIDKEKNFELLSKQIAQGTKTIKEVIMETQNKTPAEADEKLKKVIEERKKYPELFNSGEENEIKKNGFVSNKNPSSKTQEKQRGEKNQYNK